MGEFEEGAGRNTSEPIYGENTGDVKTVSFIQKSYPVEVEEHTSVELINQDDSVPFVNAEE